MNKIKRKKKPKTKKKPLTDRYGLTRKERERLDLECMANGICTPGDSWKPSK